MAALALASHLRAVDDVDEVVVRGLVEAEPTEDVPQLLHHLRMALMRAWRQSGSGWRTDSPPRPAPPRRATAP